MQAYTFERKRQNCKYAQSTRARLYADSKIIIKTINGCVMCCDMLIIKREYTQTFTGLTNLL